MGVSIGRAVITGQSRAVSVRYQFGIRPNAIFSLTCREALEYTRSAAVVPG
ncbi:Hypothetical protein PSEBR_m1582 [Pseudomonas brassicacearum subsp. brassicacearum NFM421]|uniref:Uncharacterized protein n=1 Tax=Pseudomonas brassicacearum (strain NFM421) TaxID=994484 RepID=F2KLV4_PSEBN|nr:Hypothetical protein PSEBR_m1582 [Pseudomonas brassicacearum subsp. brassicacearum NFM421]